MQTGLRRDEILRPGEYTALPKSILANTNLTPAAKLVLMSYLDHLGPENTTSWPGPATIGRETGLTRRGIQKCVEQLKTAGFLMPAGVSPKGTLVFAINAEPRPQTVAHRHKMSQCATTLENATSAQSSLPLANNVRYHRLTECATPSAQSAPELLNTTTAGNDRRNDRSNTGPLAGASAGRPLTSPAGPSSDHRGFAPFGQATGTAVVPTESFTKASPVIAEEYEAEGVGPDLPSGWDIEDQVGTSGEDGVDDDGGEACSAADTAVADAETASDPVAYAEQLTEVATAAAGAAKVRPNREERERLACTSVEAMRNYLLTERFTKGRKPNRDWTKRKLANWSVEDFACCFWVGITKRRAELGRPLTLPAWGRICAAIAARLEVRQRIDVLQFINVVTEHFEVVGDRIGGSLGNSLPLDESLLQHSVVIGAVEGLIDEARRAKDAA